MRSGARGTTDGPLRLTADQAKTFEALRDARYDINIWARDVLGVKLNPAQRRWVSLINPKANGWEWRLKFVLHVAANQIGKTLGLGIIITWGAFYKIGVPTDDSKRWFAAPYQWFHVAPSQNQAYLTLKDIVLLIKGAHPAQTLPFRLPRGLFAETKIETYYDGLSVWNGAIVQFRTTEDKAKALQGRRAAAISMDECAFEDHLNSVINETLLMRLISTGGPFIGVSTPNGINDWYSLVTSVQDNATVHELATADHWALGGSCVPGGMVPLWETEDGRGLVWSTVEDNVGYGITAADAERMERDLDESTKEQQLRGAFLEPRDAFFVPVPAVLSCFRNDLPDYTPPEVGHSYVISWDPSFAADPTAVVVLDVTSRPWRGVYYAHYRKPLGDTKLLTEIYSLHALYNGGATDVPPGREPPRAITAYDETSMGGAMLRQSLVGLVPKRGINLAGPSTKVDVLTNLRAALTTGSLLIPPAWQQLQKEVLSYKLPDTKIAQDSVMALAGAAAVAASGWSGVSTLAFRPTARTYQRRY